MYYEVGIDCVNSLNVRCLAPMTFVLTSMTTNVQRGSYGLRNPIKDFELKITKDYTNYRLTRILIYQPHPNTIGGLRGTDATTG